MKVLMFTHADLDGYGCKLVMDITMHLLDCDDYKVIICQNHDVDVKVSENIPGPGVGPDTTVIFSDIGPGLETISLLMLMVHDGLIADVRMYDHHESNLFLKDYIGEGATIYSNDTDTGKLECGTSILYMATAKFLVAKNIDTTKIDEKLYAQVVDHIRLWDTYTWKSENAYAAKQLNTMFSMIGGENLVRKYYDRIWTGGSPMFTRTELEFIDGKLDYQNSIINGLSPLDFITTEIDNYRVALLMKAVAVNISDVSDSFLSRFPEYDAVMGFNTFGNWQIQMRSNKDNINLSDLAIKLGGGGHPKAAGTSIPKSLRDLVTEAVIHFLNGRSVTATLAVDYDMRRNNDERN